MKLPDFTLVPNAVRSAQPGVAVDVMSNMVLKNADGKLTIAEISENTGLQLELTQRIALSLLLKGLLEIPGFEPETSAAIASKKTEKGTPPQNEISTKTDKIKILEIDVDGIFSSLNKKNLYELLDTEPDASRADLRSKYFSLSKRFHPDKAFGDTTGELRRKMEVIFRHLTQAYDILSNPKSRADYDLSISDIIEMWAIEKKLKSAIDGSAKKDQAPSQETPGKAPEKTPLPGRRMVIGAIDKTSQSRSQVLRNSQKKKAQVKPKSRPPRPQYEERRLQWKRERAGRAVASILDSRSSPPPSLGKAKQRLYDAQLAMEQERFSEAVRLLQEAAAIDPENANALEMLERARAGSTATLAKEHLSKGIFEQRQGNLTVAIKHFEQAVANDSENLDARHLLAEALVQAQKDLPRALTLMKEVIGLGGQRARYFATLGDILLMAKDIAKARESFEKAVSMAPDNKEYKKKLKACKK